MADPQTDEADDIKSPDPVNITSSQQSGSSSASPFLKSNGNSLDSTNSAASTRRKPNFKQTGFDMPMVNQKAPIENEVIEASKIEMTSE